MSLGFAVRSHADLSPAEVSRYYAVRHPDMVQRGGEWRSWCIRHKGKDPNFSVNAETGLWCCHSQCNCGGSVYDLEMALTNSDFKTAAREVRRIIGRPEDPPQSEREPEMKWGLPGWSHEFLKERIEKVERQNKWRHTVVYPYFDAEGRISYVKVRFLDKQNDKTFRQLGITKKLGWMTRNKAGAKPILYRLNTLAAAAEIFIVNGEKAADRGAAELEIVTTCTPDGEGKWLGDYTRPLIGKAVRIITDNDEKGSTHGAVVSAAIVKHVREVKVIRLPGLPPKGDLWDWIEAGGTRERLDEIVAKTQVEVAVETPVVNEAGTRKADGPKMVVMERNSCSAPPKISLITQLMNDTGNAERLIAFCGQDIRYCPMLRKWLVWDGQRWAVDNKGLVRKLACLSQLTGLAADKSL